MSTISEAVLNALAEAALDAIKRWMEEEGKTCSQ